MVENKIEISDSAHEFDMALQLFLDCFLEIHPKKTWPVWFKKCTTYSGHQDGRGVWRFSFTGVPSSVLGAGDSWEEKNDGYILVKTDPKTKERRFVISNTSSEIVVIFEASVDLNSGKVSVVSDKDLAEINGQNLLPLRK